MIESIFNKLGIRILTGLFVGLPITALTVIVTVYGLVFFLVGLAEGQIWLITLGVLNIVGLLGVIGAWLRIFRSTATMAFKYRRITRRFLVCGLAASIALGSWALYIEGLNEISAFFVVLTIGAVLFLYATPTSSNNSSNLTGAENAPSS